jgi:hypothetical protein
LLFFFFQHTYIGSHVETRHVSKHHSDGTTSVETIHQTIVDFKIEIDLTKYISEVGLLYTDSDPKTGKTVTIREVMEEFVNEDNPFKELHLKKVCL